MQINMNAFHLPQKPNHRNAASEKFICMEYTHPNITVGLILVLLLPSLPLLPDNLRSKKPQGQHGVLLPLPKDE